jgi:hypothetical protein
VTEISTSWPGLTAPIAVGDEPFIWSPLSNTSEYPDQLHVPAFFNRQVFVKEAPGAYVVPSGMVTSLTNCA